MSDVPADSRQPGSGGPVEFRLGDVVRLRKPHPCGNFDWTVVRLGADIGLRCNQCQRKVLLPRRTLERRMKSFLSRGPAGEADSENEAGAVTAGVAPAEPTERT
jgi:hypothetical protein